ncbi:CRTAC1 family protein [Novipirellula artificiosorum]|nr:CRTAC1 family protein [Novipirellula artificiosorum]
MNPLFRHFSLLLALSACCAGCGRNPAEQAGLPQRSNETVSTMPLAAPQSERAEIEGQALAEFNRGAGLIEQYKYSDAAEAFEKALNLAPDWTAAKFNIGLALLNLNGEKGAKETLGRARDLFLEILQAHPDHKHAHFSLGTYYQHAGDNEKALEHFRAVYELDPQDPFVSFRYAELLIGSNDHEQAREILTDIVDNDPGFTSAVYRLMIEYQRAGNPQRAMELAERFQKLKSTELTPEIYSIGKVYGASGQYYQVLGADNLPLSPRPATEVRLDFSPEVLKFDAMLVDWKQRSAPEGAGIRLAGVAAEDIDDDGDFDLCLTALDEEGKTTLWMNDGFGHFSEGAAIATQGVSPCIADVDNDGDVDLWLGRVGKDQLFVNRGDGTFQSVDSVKQADEDWVTTCARMIDVDCDGDLDLVACRSASQSIPPSPDAPAVRSSILGNNRDGTYQDLTGPLGLDDPMNASLVVSGDFDNDRDLDMVFFKASDQLPTVWVNDRAWSSHLADVEKSGLTMTHVLGATTGDPDKDGDRDLLVWTTDGMTLLENDGHFHFTALTRFADAHGGMGGTGGQFVDMDNDGDLDIVIGDAARKDGSIGPAILVNQWPQPAFESLSDINPKSLLSAIETGGPSSCVAADFTGDGKCDLFLNPIGQAPFILVNRSADAHWVGLKMAGAEGSEKKTRSNQSALGTRVDVKSGRVWQQYVVGAPSGSVAMPPLRIHAGLGDATSVQWLRVVWPDGVLQAELELAADQVVELAELQRKISSCPHLFVFNGDRYEFVSDFGGMGGLGYLAAPGIYGQPDPTEYVPLPKLAPVEGQFVMQVLEPLEEAVYFDEAKLVAVDHPVGTTVYPSELMAINVSPPSFEMFLCNDPIRPVAATDHQGRNVTAAVQAIDRQYAGATDLDPRFLGYADDHYVELDFGDAMDDLDPNLRLILCAYGWVEYSYSTTNFATDQAKLPLKAPTLSVYRDGKWIDEFVEFGYPAGLNHYMTLDVTGHLRAGDRRVRIRTNMELFWDQIFLMQHREQMEMRIQEISVANGELHDRGYPREYSPDGRHPNLLDYTNIDRGAPWKRQEGDYTRFGEVTELLHEPDDRYVIFGPGEELTLKFDVDSLEPLRDGFTRSYLLKADSYCKDMDLYTAEPDTISPLPFHGMSAYPYPPSEHYPKTPAHVEYRRKYNTRSVRSLRQ